MLFADISLIDEDFNHRCHQWVGVVDGRISFVDGTAPRAEDAQAYGEVYDGTGKLLMPAFYNAHAHAPMTMLRGYAENMALQAWLNEKVWPFEAQMTPADNYWATLLACAEMARFGVVGFSDMYYATRERAQAVIESGLKANLCEGLLAFEPKPYVEYPICALNEELVRELHGKAGGRILVDYNIHAEYTSNPLVCSDIARIARNKGLRIHLHASETQLEHEECKQRHNGMTPLAYFDSLGVLDVPVTAAHCVWCEPDDLDILADKDVFVAANPASNMKLGSGYAPVPAMLERGIKVCLGTDGMASNNNHDMMQDMYLLATIYKGYAHDPSLVTPKQALNAATRMGALAQGREDCGLVKEGMKADLAVLDVTGPAYTPMTNPLVNVVFAGHGSDVCLTMSDGEVVYRDGIYPTIDVVRVKAEVEQRTRRIIAGL